MLQLKQNLSWSFENKEGRVSETIKLLKIVIDTETVAANEAKMIR